jgi:spore coat polysaccharide biosynthesis protein SpsF (cytidylyltransferase family)
MKIGIIICSRSNSSRISQKPLRLVGHKIKTTIIQALCHRLKKTKLPVIVAIPHEDFHKYTGLGLNPFLGDAENPLKRMLECAEYNRFDAVVRVCHDKIFVDHNLINMAVDLYRGMNVDYLYSSHFTEGMGFEIISTSALKRAYNEFNENVEHISFAIKAITQNIHNWEIPSPYRSNFRLLIDYPDDLKVIDAIFKRFKGRTLEKDTQTIFDFLRIYPSISSGNKSPEITVYTCVYNGERYLHECINSVISQKIGCKIEYLIIDDKSRDESSLIAEEYSREYPYIRIIKNKKNVGLASSSNVALTHARGKYIIRLDADDYFTGNRALEKIYRWIKYAKDFDAIYPNNFFGNMDTIQKGNESHHVGGSMFKTRKLNDIKFTDGLRGYEGLDLYTRAKDNLKIGYLDEVIFFYRQHVESLTKNNLEERKKIKEKILNGSV